MGYLASVNTTFPDVTLYFEGGAMQLTPQNYLFQQEITSTSGQTIAADCLGWLESVSQPGYISYTIFGDIVLKDKLVVYDNEQHQIGWKNYDCKYLSTIICKSISMRMEMLLLPLCIIPQFR
jgi:hypothetical protein